MLESIILHVMYRDIASERMSIEGNNILSKICLLVLFRFVTSIYISSSFALILHGV